jgi:hypothetical protein
LHDLSRAALIQQSVYETQTEQSLGFTLDLSGRLHPGLFTQQFSTLKFAKLSRLSGTKCKLQNAKFKMDKLSFYKIYIFHFALFIFQ